MYLKVSFILLLINLVDLVSCFYEYVCEESFLFKPYLRVYAGRTIAPNGVVIMDVGPGLHQIYDKSDKHSNMTNIYVCINGPAFIYYSTTKLNGQEIFEAPQEQIFVHHCETHNVVPYNKATKVDFELKLTAVLLYGDKDDYRKPSIQTFLAPYFFGTDKYAMGFPAHYQYATSVAIIGRSECTLLKGNKNDVKIPIKFQSFIENVPKVPADDEETNEYLCKQGFSKFLRKSIKADATQKEIKDMKTLVNDEPIVERPGGACYAYHFDEDTFKETTSDLQERKKNFLEQWNIFSGKGDGQPISTQFRERVNAATRRYMNSIEKIDKSLANGFTKTKEQREQLLAKKEEIQRTKIDPENAKIVAFDAFVVRLVDASKDVQQLNADDLKTKYNEAVKFADKHKRHFDLVELSPNPDNLDIKFNETKGVKEKNNTKNNATYTDLEDGDYEDYEELSGRATPVKKSGIFNNMNATEMQELVASTKDWEFKVPLAESLLQQARDKINNYKLGPVKKQNQALYTERTEPNEFAIHFNPTTSTAIPNQRDCVKLPRVTPDPQDSDNVGECKKGKPDSAESCQLLKTVLGRYQVWKSAKNDSNSENVTEYWKKEILDLNGQIFINACPKLPNRKKFVKLVNFVMGYYLTNTDPAFYYQLPKPGTTLACLAFQSWKKQINPTIEKSDSNRNREKREHWNTIIKELQQCVKRNRILIFREAVEREQYPHNLNRTHLNYQWIKPGKKRTKRFLTIYKEQAEKEYAFNWVIDMIWNIFATTLGICIPQYERRIPDMISRFYSMFTEDFLLPLRETWINPRHNMIFQWILSEFYNGDAELWARHCMEASFLYAEQDKWRPPRPLMVNCEAENNYIIDAPFHQGLYTKPRSYLRK